MSELFGVGSLAAFLVDFIDNQPERAPEIWFEHVDYEAYIHSPEWKEKADKAKERAEHRCQMCYRTRKLEAHHRTYIRLGHELDTDITVLCDECHDIYTKRGKIKPYVATDYIPF